MKYRINPEYAKEVISNIMTLDKAQEIAENFMKENGYKLTEIGRNQALNDLYAIDDDTYDPEDLLLLQACIAFMKLEDK